ncbi:hypothetical protein [Streptomyces hirsutus]|uniref:hypothetical protein n=1 Tax=Streptomyces hirsutus TaxID=35620 RepID=UPI00332BD69A
MTSTLAPPAGADRFDTALMSLPYGEWTPMSEVTRRLRGEGLAVAELTAFMRRARRRGVLRTQVQTEGAYVMRVGREPWNRQTLVP